MKEYADKMKLAHKLAQEAGKVALTHFPRTASQAAQEAESLMRDILAWECPEDAVAGPELGSKGGSNEYRWVLQPLDGRISFLLGAPTFGLTVGLLHREEPVVGVVQLPALKESYFAGKGLGSWWLGSRVGDFAKAEVSKVSDSAAGLLCLPTLGRFLRQENTPSLQRALKSFGRSQEWDGCYGHLLVASGRAEAMMDFSAPFEESVALYCIVTEAGGHFLDRFGEAGFGQGCAISTNAHLYPQLRSLLA